MSIDRSLLTDIESVPTDQYFAQITAPWVNKSNCFCRIAKFDIGKFVIIEHWRKNLLRPLIINFVYFFTLVNVIFDVYPTLTTKIQTALFLSIVLFSFFCLFLSFWLIIIRGPGYAPYNWEQNNGKLTWEQEMDNIAIYEEQVQYARQAARPPRSSFSVDARRFVLRADHFCIWTNSWIGFFNHRFFILLTLWADIYCISWLVFRYNWYLTLFHPFKWYQIISLIASIPVFYSIYFATVHFITSIKNLSNGVTVVEKHHQRSVSKYDQGCFGNFSEICGPKAAFLLWPFPFACLPLSGNGLYQEYV